MSAQFIYYVYAYLRKNGTPYYIGKGKGNRAYGYHYGRKPGFVPRDPSKIIFLEKNLSEVGALALERRMIRWYGRKDNGTGILRNLTDGGDGGTGVYGRILSQEHKDKISSSNTGKRRSHPTTKGVARPDEVRKKISESNKGKPKSEEHRKKLSEVKVGKTTHMKGKEHSDTTKQKISEANKGRKWWNNGLYCKMSRECPGAGWVEGRLTK